MFESDMLLPNLGFNPGFEEKQPEDKKLLVLEDGDTDNSEAGDVNDISHHVALNLAADS